MEEKIKELRTKLENTPYNQFKAVLTDMQLKKAYSPGTAKKTLIEKAIKLYETINLKSKEPEEIEKEEKLKEAEKLDPQVETNPARLIELTKEKKEEKTYPKEVLMEMLKVCKANLKNGIPAQRGILLKEQIRLEKLLGL